MRSIALDLLPEKYKVLTLKTKRSCRKTQKEKLYDTKPTWLNEEISSETELELVLEHKMKPIRQRKKVVEKNNTV